MMMLEFETQCPAPPVSVRSVRLSGEIDVCTAPEAFRQIVESGPEPGDHVLVDLAEVEFMDSHGVAMLLRAKAYVDALGCALTLAGISPRVHRLLRLVGLADEFVIDARHASH